MKNKIVILTISSLILSLINSCAKPQEACFNIFPTTITTSTSVEFDASCTKYGGYSYNWDFGDGTSDTTVMSVPTITHTFNTSGTYTITLNAGRKDGVVWKENNKHITTRTITVQ